MLEGQRCRRVGRTRITFMPFHLDSHKPQPPRPKSVAFPPKNRVRANALGCLLIIGGLLRIKHGVFFVINWYRAPISSHLMVVGGVIMIVVALIPLAWIERAAKWTWTPSN
jgi:hypothetical protein